MSTPAKNGVTPPPPIKDEPSNLSFEPSRSDLNGPTNYPSHSSTYTDGSLRGSVSDSSIRASGDRHDNLNWSRRHHYGGSSSDSDSDFYNEDDSENSDGFLETPTAMHGSTSSAALRRGGGETPKSNDFLRRADSASDGARGSTASAAARSSNPDSSSTTKRSGSAGGGVAGVNHMRATDGCLSYFHHHNTAAISIRNELVCYFSHLRHLFKTIEEDRLPWATDFADFQKLRMPRKMKEIGGRLNLNIPYYSSNYIEVFYIVTMPFLLFYNTPFFLVMLATMIMIHSVAMRRKSTRVYGESVTVLGRRVSYHTIGHVLLFAFAMLFMFFNGLRTVLWVLFINACLIVPHAIIRRPTYFDDEDLEKCRPKLAQYAIVVLLLALDYLEGDVKNDDMTESRRLVERERKRLASVLEKREAKD